MTAPAGTMRWRVESWDPGYGTSRDDPAELNRSRAELVLDVELPAARWRPLDPAPDRGGTPAVLFVDGVRRIDAMAWIEDADPGGAGDAGGAGDSGGAGGTGDSGGAGSASLALCASYAAGVVRCRPDGARLVAAEVRRGLFTAARVAADVHTSAGRYAFVPVEAGGEPGTALSQAVQRALGQLEAAVASGAGLDDPSELLVVDGPLHGRQHLPRVLGYVKTHRSEYLPAALHRMVGGLAPGQRTPLFVLSSAELGSSWQRLSWYLKLPGGADGPWAGVVRVECPADRPVAEVIELADRSAPLLCRHASTEYKDARAPQNLYPIAGLERELRRRLGDQALLYRAIRRASTGA